MKKEAKNTPETQEITFLQPANIKGVDYIVGSTLEVSKSLADHLISLGIAS